MTTQEVEVFDSIDYGSVKNEKDFIDKVSKKDAKLAEKLRLVNETIYSKINALPEQARQYMLKTIERVSSFASESSVDGIFKSIRGIIKDYSKLSKDDQNALVTAFPCIGEMMKSWFLLFWEFLN
ncbi:unnamed protein product [Anisakis simplex]|nr:unnamed protein product [Anisakis simplex]